MPVSSKEEQVLGIAKATFDYYKGVKDAFTDIVGKVDSQVDSANKLRISFQQTFGMFSAEEGRSLVKNFADVSTELINQGVTAEKLAEAYKTVGAGINNFIINRSGEAVESFSKLAAINSKFGVDMQSTVGIINYLSTSFGKSTEYITSFSNKLMQFSRETGQEFKKVFQDFNSSIQSFYTILDPDKAATQFMSFQQMARGFGSTIDKLMATAAKFDDIEQGVQFGTQLNNVLSAVGGSFDSMLASTMNYDDRIKLIVQSIANSRDQINNMSEVSQRAYIRQLEQTTGLGGQTIQAILKNNELVGSIDQLTAKQFDQIKEAPVDKMADNFTTFQDRANLYMNQYLKIGARLEGWFDQSSKNIRDIQKKILGDVVTETTKARTAKELIDNLMNQFSTQKLKDRLKDAADNIDKSSINLIDAVTKGLQPGSSRALEYKVKPPGKTESPAGTGGGKLPYENRNIYADEVKIAMKEGTKEGHKEAIIEAAKLFSSQQITIHLTPTPELLAFFKKQEASTTLGAAR